MLIDVLTLLLSSAGGPPSIPREIPAGSNVEKVELLDRKIRIGDLAILAGKESIEIGSLPNGVDAVTIDRPTALRMIRNHLPFAQFTLQFTEAIVLHAPRELTALKSCWRTIRQIDAGSVILRSDVEQADCLHQTDTSQLKFSRELGAPIARVRIEANEMLDAFRPTENAPIPAGRKVIFLFNDGPVTVEREVITLQPWVPNRRIFTRTLEGTVIVAPTLEQAEGKRE